MAATTTTDNPSYGMRRDENAGDRVEGAMDSMAENADAARERLSDAASRAAGTARDKVNRVADATSDTVDRWSSRTQDTLDRASDTASYYASQFGEKGGQLMEDARDYVGAHPLRTLGIAAAAGFLIGRMIR